MGGGGGYNSIGQLPFNLQNYVGGSSYPGMQTGNQRGGGYGGGQGNYNAMTQDMSRGQMGNYGFNPQQGFQYQAWPGQGYGGMPGRYGGNQGGPGGGGGYGGYFGGSGFGYSGGGNPYGPGSYSSPGAMPYGGGRGMMGGQLFNQRGAIGRAMGQMMPAIGNMFGGGGYGGGGYGGGGYGGGGWGGYGGYVPPQPAQQVPQYVNQRSQFGGFGGGGFPQVE